jgi:hypothetical protein
MPTSRSIVHSDIAAPNEPRLAAASPYRPPVSDAEPSSPAVIVDAFC